MRFLCFDIHTMILVEITEEAWVMKSCGGQQYLGNGDVNR
jgi:hypothetical protein